MKYFSFFLFLCTTLAVTGQVPSSNLYAFDYRVGDNGQVVLRNPQLLTATNLKGYDNQPKFFGASELYYTRQLEDDSQSDLIKLDLKGKKSYRFTRTRQSEYSPTLTPDGAHLSCIRVEDDGTQVLWKYPLDRSHRGSRILPDVEDVGYHYWVSPTDVVMFLVGAPIRLVIANIETGEVSNITTKAGRCFGEMENGDLLFVYKYTETIWHLKAYDWETKRSRFIAETLPGSEDFVMLEDGTILMGSKSKLYRNEGTQWKEVASLASYDISNISRMAYENGKLILVGN